MGNSPPVVSQRWVLPLPELEEYTAGRLADPCVVYEWRLVSKWHAAHLPRNTHRWTMPTLGPMPMTFMVMNGRVGVRLESTEEHWGRILDLTVSWDQCMVANVLRRGSSDPVAEVVLTQWAASIPVADPARFTTSPPRRRVDCLLDLARPNCALSAGAEIPSEVIAAFANISPVDWQRFLIIWNVLHRPSYIHTERRRGMPINATISATDCSFHYADGRILVFSMLDGRFQKLVVPLIKER